MPQFIVLCRDKPNALALRKETRPAHLEYFENYGNKGLLAGPMLGPDGEPIGSMLVIEAENEETARAFAANDPYAKAGVFASTEIIPFKPVFANMSESKA